jgi:hypothetical protein
MNAKKPVEPPKNTLTHTGWLSNNATILADTLIVSEKEKLIINFFI